MPRLIEQLPMAKKKREDGLIVQLQDAIRTSGKSLYRVAKDSAIGLPQLTRFMTDERGLSLESAERVCRVLGLELMATKKTRKPQMDKNSTTP